MQISSDVCVIGSGAIGKAAALALTQAGAQVVLLGSEPVRAGDDASWDTRVYALNQTSRDFLAELRVWDALDPARVARVDAMEIYGDDAGRLSFDAYGAHRSELAWIVEDRNLNTALDAALRFAPALKRMSARASRLQVDASRARIDLDDDHIEAALVVGADGAQSWVRSQCGIDIDYRSYRQRAVVANFACSVPHRDIAYQWFTTDEGIVALLPLPGQRVSLVWSAPEALAATLIREPVQTLARRLTTLSAGALGELSPLVPEQINAFPLNFLRPHAITAPRVTLVGDAAHVIHPLAGHGMNLGFADVAALLEIQRARESHRDPGDPRVLARYSRARREDVLLMQLATDGLERLFSADLEPVKMIRNLGLNLVNKLPVLKRSLMAHAMGKHPH